MSKNCKCNGKCESQMMDENKFYLGVNDITMYRARYDVFEKEVVLSEDESYRSEGNYDPYHYREFTSKFVEDPMIAIINAIAVDSRESNDPKFRKWVMENLRYSKDSECFYIDQYLTLGVELPPKECQWEKFFAGEYEFICIRHEIQILQTILPKIDLKTLSKGIGYDMPIKEIPEPMIEETYHPDECFLTRFNFRYKVKDLPIKDRM